MAPTTFLDYLWDFIPPNKQEIFLDRIQDRTRFMTVVLEDIYQPQNASAVMRTCDCFGVQDIHIIENRNEWEYNPEVERGSSKWLSIYRYNQAKNNTQSCVNALLEKGYEIVATTPHTESTLDDFNPQKPLALVMGTEKHGVSDTILNKAHHLVKIPMVGFTESLNLSVAAAICIYNLWMQIKKNGCSWQLTDQQRESILLEWCKKIIKNHELYFKRFSELPKG